MFEDQTQEAGLYFMVSTQGRFKIGFSKNVAGRAAQVMPDDLIRSISWAVFFKDPKRAQECEKSLHKLFSKYRLPALPGDGGTEFFSMECFEQVKKLVKSERHSFGYKRLELNGEKLFPESIRPSALVEILPERLKRRTKGSVEPGRYLGANVPSELFHQVRSLSETFDRKMQDLTIEAWNDLLSKYGAV